MSDKKDELKNHFNFNKLNDNSKISETGKGNMKREIIKMLNEQENKIKLLEKEIEILEDEYSKKSNHQGKDYSEEFKKGFDLCRDIIYQDILRLKKMLSELK